MQQEERVGTVVTTAPEENDPFRYGWRYIRRAQPDGTMVIDEIPLTQEDLLYPEEDDFVVQEPWHTRDFIYCHSTIEAVCATQPHVVVLGDCRVDWGVQGVRPLGPDILVLFNVPEWHHRPTFTLADEGGEPMVVLEIASPSTRNNDLGIKHDLYYQVGVQKYVIVDRGPHGEDPVRIFGFQRAPRGWVPMALDAQGRLDLAPVGLLLGIEDDRPWLYDAATGAREPERKEWRQALSVAEERVQEAEEQTQNAEERAQNAEERAQNAEERAQNAEERAQNAEVRAREEAQSRAALEERLRALEAELHRQRGGTA